MGKITKNLRSFIFYFLTSCTIVLFIACDKKEQCEDTITQNIPSCIREMLSDSLFTRSIRTIQLQNINGHPYYWINTGATNSDGIEYIWSSCCEEACFFCGDCSSSRCFDIFSEDDWQIVWKK